MGKIDLRGNRDGAGRGHKASLTAVEKIGRKGGWVGKILDYSAVALQRFSEPRLPIKGAGSNQEQVCLLVTVMLFHWLERTLLGVKEHGI